MLDPVTDNRAVTNNAVFARLKLQNHIRCGTNPTPIRPFASVYDEDGPGYVRDALDRLLDDINATPTFPRLAKYDGHDVERLNTNSSEA